MEETILKFMLQLSKDLARQFGSNCEVVVHDLTSNDENSTIVAIENGHVSGRKIGDGPSHIVMETLKNPDKQPDNNLCYLTKTADGKILKSSTIVIRDSYDKPIGIFAINYDITLMLAMEDMLRQFTSVDQPEKEPKNLSRNVVELLDHLIEQSVAVVGKPVSLMSKDDKIKAIQFLNETGAFLVTKSGDKVCKYFGISKYTLYMYIDEAKK